MFALLNAGKVDEAKLICKEMLSFNSKKGHEAFGYFYLKIKHYEEAVEHFLKALHHGNVSDSVLRGLGYAYFSSFHFKEALDYFMRVKDKSADDYFMIFSSYVLLRDPMSARSYLDMAYQSDPERTAYLMRRFYTTLVSSSPDITEEEKKALEAEINNYLSSMNNKAGGGS